MHVLIPFASACSDEAVHVLRDLQLPVLARLLSTLLPTHRDAADASTLSPPHERALAAAWGWAGEDGAWPFAARAAAADGVDVGEAAWGLLTPAHWLTGRDHVTMLDPSALELDAAESRALFDTLRPLFETEGFTFAWGAPLRWYVAHPDLAGLHCASLDRVIGGNVAPWSSASHAGRLLRRLQSEAQLAFYPHPINEAREARGALTVNSFWVSGCGVHQAERGDVDVVPSLRGPMLAADWAGWADAWRALDRGALERLLARCAAGEPVALTLCGERHAQRFESGARPLWARLASRWRAPTPHAVLEAL